MVLFDVTVEFVWMYTVVGEFGVFEVGEIQVRGFCVD